MKKLCLFSLVIILLSGCNQRIEKFNQEEFDQEEQVEEIIEENKYIDNNPIELSFYMYYGNSINRKKLTELKLPFKEWEDLCSLEIYYTKEDEISSNKQKNIWDQYYQQYTDIDNYRIGYKISFVMSNNKEISKYILSPADTDELFNYIQIYLYDDIHVADGQWYSHVTSSEYNEDTILTSIKLTSSYETKNIISPITLEAFTYDDDDFDESNNYRGNSKTAIIILIE